LNSDAKPTEAGQLDRGPPDIDADNGPEQINLDPLDPAKGQACIS
jgi:hypothetical protein